MRDLKTKIALTVMGLAMAATTTACQNGFMSIGQNAGDDEMVDGERRPGSTGDDGEAGPGGIDDLVNAPEACVPQDRFFMREVWAPVVHDNCQSCHNPMGAAKDSDLIFYGEGWGNYIERNMDLLAEFAETKRNGESVLLLKPSGLVSHGGGAVIQEGDDSYNRLKAFVDRVENPVECAEVTDEDFYQDVLFLDSEQTLRKATLSLAGRLPTEEELAGDIDTVLESVMSEDAFYDRLTESFNDLLLTDQYLPGDNAIDLLDEDVFPNARYYEDIGDDDARRAERDRANDAVAREPLALFRHVVENNRPFTEVITADYTMVNPFSARVYGIMDQVTFQDDSDPNEWVEATIPGQPHAGVLTTVTFLNRYPTTDTNRNRHRSAIFYRYFLATDVLKLADRPIDPTQADLSQNPTLFNEQCTVCHGVVDPIAGAFQNWDDDGQYNPMEDGWYTDMLPPGMEGQNMSSEEWGNSLAWLANKAATDNRFVESAIEHAYKILTGESPLTLPTDATRPDYEAAFRAYEVQYQYFKQLGEKFVAADYDFKALIKEIVKSPYYRAYNARSVSPKRQAELAEIGTARLLTPEMLHRKIIATTGTSWRANNRDVLMDTREFKLLYGGIDSISITSRMKALNPLAASIARRMSNEVSCQATATDFARPMGERVMFPNVTMDDTPDTNDAAVRANIKHLHWQLLGEKLEDNDPELQRAYDLFRDVWQDGNNNDYGDLPGACRADGVDSDPNYTVRAWMAVVSYMLSSYKFLHE